METVLKDMSPDAREEAKLYIFRNEIPQLFESLTAGLLHHRPAHPVEFVQDCLDTIRPAPGQPNPSPRWATFIDWRPAPNSRSVSRMVQSATSRPKSRASTTDSGFRDISSASTAGRTTSLSASSRTRMQVTPEVPAEKPSGDDISTSGAAAPEQTPDPVTDPSPEEEVAKTRPGTGHVSIIDDPVAEEPEEDDFDPTSFEPPNM